MCTNNAMTANCVRQNVTNVTTEALTIETVTGLITNKEYFYSLQLDYFNGLYEYNTSVVKKCNTRYMNIVI